MGEKGEGTLENLFPGLSRPTKRKRRKKKKWTIRRTKHSRGEKRRRGGGFGVRQQILNNHLEKWNEKEGKKQGVNYADWGVPG